MSTKLRARGFASEDAVVRRVLIHLLHAKGVTKRKLAQDFDLSEVYVGRLLAPVPVLAPKHQNRHRKLVQLAQMHRRALSAAGYGFFVTEANKREKQS